LGFPASVSLWWQSRQKRVTNVAVQPAHLTLLLIGLQLEYKANWVADLKDLKPFLHLPNARQPVAKALQQTVCNLLVYDLQDTTNYHPFSKINCCLANTGD
jgi:hypothetical protein